MDPRQVFALAALGAALVAPALPADSPAVQQRRREYPETLQKIPSHTTAEQLTGRISAQDKDWEDWLRRTGELPPDFESMPSIPGLPDPLRLHEGSRTVPITTPEQWTQQRRWIRSQFERWIRQDAAHAGEPARGGHGYTVASQRGGPHLAFRAQKRPT